MTMAVCFLIVLAIWSLFFSIVFSFSDSFCGKHFTQVHRWSKGVRAYIHLNHRVLLHRSAHLFWLYRGKFMLSLPKQWKLSRNAETGTESDALNKTKSLSGITTLNGRSMPWGQKIKCSLNRASFPPRFSIFCSKFPFKFLPDKICYLRLKHVILLYPFWCTQLIDRNGMRVD